jgi:hypothetical protein
MPARLPGEPVDQRPVQQTAEHRDDHEETQPEPRQMRTAYVPGLAELVVPVGAENLIRVTRPGDIR